MHRPSFEDFTGYWCLVRTENVDGLLRHVGTPWVVRRAAVRFGSEAVELVRAHEGSVSVTTLCAKGSWSRRYEPGNVAGVRQTNALGEQVVTVVSWEEDGQVLRAETLGSKMGSSRSWRTVIDGVMIVRLEVEAPGPAAAGAAAAEAPPGRVAVAYWFYERMETLENRLSRGDPRTSARARAALERALERDTERVRKATRRDDSRLASVLMDWSHWWSPADDAEGEGVQGAVGSVAGWSAGGAPGAASPGGATGPSPPPPPFPSPGTPTAGGASLVSPPSATTSTAPAYRTLADAGPVTSQGSHAARGPSLLASRRASYQDVAEVGSSGGAGGAPGQSIGEADGPERQPGAGEAPAGDAPPASPLPSPSRLRPSARPPTHRRALSGASTTSEREAAIAEAAAYRPPPPSLPTSPGRSPAQSVVAGSTTRDGLRRDCATVPGGGAAAAALGRPSAATGAGEGERPGAAALPSLEHRVRVFLEGRGVAAVVPLGTPNDTTEPGLLGMSPEQAEITAAKLRELETGVLLKRQARPEGITLFGLFTISRVASTIPDYLRVWEMLVK